MTTGENLLYFGQSFPFVCFTGNKKQETFTAGALDPAQGDAAWTDHEMPAAVRKRVYGSPWAVGSLFHVHVPDAGGTASARQLAQDSRASYLATLDRDPLNRGYRYAEPKGQCYAPVLHRVDTLAREYKERDWQCRYTAEIGHGAMFRVGFER